MQSAATATSIIEQQQQQQQQDKDKDCTTSDIVTSTTTTTTANANATTTACKANAYADHQIEMNAEQQQQQLKLNDTAEQLQQQQQQLAVQLEELPDEILEFILTYLPPYKDLEHCRLVSKRWHHIVKNLIRRSKLNLHKGLLDYRLRWQVHTPYIVDPSSLPIPHFASNPCCGGASLPIIAGRFSHSAVRHNNSMYVFGGGSSSDTTFNDLWRFDLSEMRWERPLSMGTYPSPKGSASMVCWEEQLILFGGWRYPSLHPPYQPWCLFDELHFYDLATQRWTVHVSLPAPPPMAGHSASVHGDMMIVFGGYQIAEGVNSNSNETWCYDLRNWKWWQPRFANNTKPPPRYGQFQLALDDRHLLIVGGCGGPNSVYSDAWLLDMSERECFIWRSIPVRNKKYGASHMWYNPACKVGSKLIVLGPTPNMPQDFQMMRQMRMPVGGGMPGPRLAAVRGGLIAQQQQQQQQQQPRRLDAQRGMGELNGDGDQFRVLPARLNNYRLVGGAAGGGGGAGGLRPGPLDDQYYANRRAVLNQHLQQAQNNFLNNNGNNPNHNNSHVANVNSLHNNNNNNNNNHLQPRTGRLSDLHATSTASTATVEEHNSNRPTTSQAAIAGGVAAGSAAARLNGASRTDNEQQLAANGTAQTSSSGVGAGVGSGSGVIANGSASHNNKDVEAANRLQRNLALRCRENEPLLPKRFDELFEDPFRMAAFNVQGRSRNLSKDHNERIRRMEEKMNAIRNSRRNIAAVIEPKCIKEPSPKRVKRNVLSLFVCDLSGALDPADPHLQWIEYKNYGVIPGAPERLILSTMVAGHGELILFGGVHKETLNEITHQVSNSIHFLSAPRDIV